MRPAPIGSVTNTNTIGMVSVAFFKAVMAGLDWARMTSGPRGDQLSSKRLRARSGGRIAVINMKVGFGPTKSSQFLLERLQVRIIEAREHADAPDAARLLRTRRKRPCDG